MTSEINATKIEAINEKIVEYKADTNDRLRSIENFQKLEITMIVITILTTLLTSL